MQNKYLVDEGMMEELLETFYRYNELVSCFTSGVPDKEYARRSLEALSKEIPEVGCTYSDLARISLSLFEKVEEDEAPPSMADSVETETETETETEAEAEAEAEAETEAERE